MDLGMKILQVLFDAYKPFFSLFIAWGKVFSGDFREAFVANPLWFTVILLIIGVVFGVFKKAIRFVLTIFSIFIAFQILLYLLDLVKVMPNGMQLPI